MTDYAFAPKDSAERKACPVASGVVKYFPDALMLVSRLSRIGNDKHSPGQPLHWAKEKSGDEPDALMRHLIDHFTGAPIDADVEELGELAHLTQVAWRALAMLQRACDAERAKDARPSAEDAELPESIAAAVRIAARAEAEASGKNACDHGLRFDANDAWARRLPPSEVRRQYPRLYGSCPKGCGFNGIAYVSHEHFIAGDW